MFRKEIVSGIKNKIGSGQAIEVKDQSNSDNRKRKKKEKTYQEHSFNQRHHASSNKN